MPRIPRLLITGESTAYHVMSRTALDGLPLEDLGANLGQANYLLTFEKDQVGRLGTEVGDRKLGN